MGMLDVEGWAYLSGNGDTVLARVIDVYENGDLHVEWTDTHGVGSSRILSDDFEEA